MTSPLDRISASMRHPVRFEDNGVERCLTLDEASAMLRRIERAIAQAHVEIAAGPMALPICSRCNDTHVMRSGHSCTGCPVPCDRASCRLSACSAYCDRTPCACPCHADNHMYRRAREAATPRTIKATEEKNGEKA